jgi:hypothetical protein
MIWHYATSRKVPGLIPGGVRVFFRGIPTIPFVWGRDSDSWATLGGKDGRCLRITTYYLKEPMTRNLEALTSLNPLGPIGLKWEFFTFFTNIKC